MKRTTNNNRPCYEVETIELKAKVKELEEMLGKTLADLHISNEQIIGLEATLDEIKKIDEELTRTDYGYWTIQSLHKAIQKALAKYEGKNNGL